MDRPSDEVAEIERHKYFLSEQNGHDVGWETAEDDWEREHATQWRAKRAKAADRPAAPTASQEPARQDSQLKTDTADTVSTSHSPHVGQREPRGSNWFKKLLGRFSA